MNAAEISITMRVATTKTAATEAPDRFWALVKNLREHGTVPDHMEILLKGDPILAEAKDQYRREVGVRCRQPSVRAGDGDAG